LASRKFCDAIHGYAQSIGKDNFLLVGELTDDNMARGYVDIFGRNLDALLDIVVAPNRLSSVVKGLAHPNDFFCLYDDRTLAGSQRQLGTYHVAVLDDHDMASRPRKERFAAHSDQRPHRYEQVAHAVGLMLTMPGIPSIYYGTEQAFDGSQDYHDYGIEPEGAYDEFVVASYEYLLQINFWAIKSRAILQSNVAYHPPQITFNLNRSTLAVGFYERCYAAISIPIHFASGIQLYYDQVLDNEHLHFHQAWGWRSEGQSR
jgi:glycosidase